MGPEIAAEMNGDSSAPRIVARVVLGTVAWCAAGALICASLLHALGR